MSSIYADNVVAPWIQNNRWSTTGEEDDDLLVISVPSAASADVNGPVQWNSGVSGQFEVYTHWDLAQERLNQTSVHIEVPGFGPVVFFSDKSIDMKNTKPISVSLPGAGVYGDVQFVYGDAKKDIKLNWNITVPWFGHLNDGRSLFPTERSSPFLANKLQNVKVITDSEVSALKAAPLSEFQVVRDRADKELILFDTSAEGRFLLSVSLFKFNPWSRNDSAKQ
ncbi:hypothetical protein M378DRAFT_584640 [Amanita muscaria Koide BX008]|uniref:Uncharacterized protein n=1 Tax=Amanita muscaria (strain Koide BX008) TaxID=946122 RepID=A0A0C2WHI9_AMAMK|nr:hypothetical protein M378DRAFT_584640 [Amanita muscaria Koide BX008]